jgi:PPOX class probable F420-dependent enzyme
MESMTHVEIQAFLAHGTRTGKLATVREDGRPHIAPIWFVLDGEDCMFNTWHESVKALNMRRDPRVSLCVDEELAPYAFVVLEGTVQISNNPLDLIKWASAIAARYMGQDLAQAYGVRNSVEGELLVRLQPSKIIAHKDLAGW